jgi:hypothetical protein
MQHRMVLRVKKLVEGSNGFSAGVFLALHELVFTTLQVERGET